ncbi:hypothetical protein A2U01_0117553, partial [Trifolium medium]|nr:hypothetical protein [Trifolium medium]
SCSLTSQTDGCGGTTRGWLYRAGRLHVAYPSRHCSYGRHNRLDLAHTGTLKGFRSGLAVT